MSVRIDTPADAVSVVPPLLGVVPSNSVVAVFVGNAKTMGARFDFPADTALVDHAAAVASRNGNTHAFIVFAPAEPIGLDEMRATWSGLEQHFEAHSIQPLMVISTTGFTKGRWVELISGDAGIVQDWRGTELAANAVLRGEAVYAHADEFAEFVAVLADEHHGPVNSGEATLKRVRAALSEGSPVTDVARLAASLAPHLDHGKFRDLLIGAALDHPVESAATFAILARYVRGQARTHLLVLAAASAYIGGNGMQARLLIEESVRHSPTGSTTTMGSLVMQAMTFGMVPTMLADEIGEGAALAQWP